MHGHSAGAPPGGDPGGPQLAGTVQQVSEDHDDVKADTALQLFIVSRKLPQRMISLIFLIKYYELVLSIIPLLDIPVLAVS